MTELSELKIEDLNLGKFSLPDAIEKYEKNDMKSVHLAPIKINDSPLKLLIKGQIFTDGIIVSEEFKTHSIGFELEESDVKIFNSLYDIFGNNFQPDELNEWEQKEALKDENKLWLRLKTDKSKSSYKSKCNARLHPKKPLDAPLQTGEKLEATLSPSAYFSVKDKSYGICLQVTDLYLPDYEQPSSKKQKTN